MKLLCSKCGLKPRCGQQRWCRECKATYQGGYMRRVRARNKPVNVQRSAGAVPRTAQPVGEAYGNGCYIRRPTSNQS